MKTYPNDFGFRGAKVQKSSVNVPIYPTFLYLISKSAYDVNPILRAFSISNCISGSRSFSTRLSSTASFRHCFSTPTSREGRRWKSVMISLPSMTGCNSRL